MVEQYGRLQVRHAKTGQPLSKVYVKVYAQTPQGAKFFKDGYTDLRGKFDYASLSTDELERVSAFSVLVLNDEFGATIREAAPPKQ